MSPLTGLSVGTDDDAARVVEPLGGEADAGGTRKPAGSRTLSAADAWRAVVHGMERRTVTATVAYRLVVDMNGRPRHTDLVRETHATDTAAGMPRTAQVPVPSAWVVGSTEKPARPARKENRPCRSGKRLPWGGPFGAGRPRAPVERSPMLTGYLLGMQLRQRSSCAGPGSCAFCGQTRAGAIKPGVAGQGAKSRAVGGAMSSGSHTRSLRIKLPNDYRRPRFIATVPGQG